MGATSSSSAEADRLLRGLSPKEIAEAEKGFEDLRGPDGVITPATYTARLPGPCHPLPQALGERLFRVVYEVPEGESTVDWVQFLRTLLRIKGKGSTRHAHDAFKSHDDILACSRSFADDEAFLSAVERTLVDLLHGNKVFMTDKPATTGTRDSSLDYEAFRRLSRVLPGIFEFLSLLSDPVPREPALPTLQYSLSATRSILTPPRALLLSTMLGPIPWTQVFHSDKGKAWPMLLSSLEDKHPTLVLVRTVEGSIIGGYSTAAWYRSAKFFGGGEEGGGSSCVFSLHPRACVYPSTGFNENFQYLASGCTVNPNGVGLGGARVGNFALFISASLDAGHSFPSATFNNLHLHGGEASAFGVDVVEVWCPSSALEGEGEGGRCNVLQNEKFKADQVILGLAGKFQGHNERA